VALLAPLEGQHGPVISTRTRLVKGSLEENLGKRCELREFHFRDGHAAQAERPVLPPGSAWSLLP
jgi:hypothetical protein